MAQRARRCGEAARATTSYPTESTQCAGAGLVRTGSRTKQSLLRNRARDRSTAAPTHRQGRVGGVPRSSGQQRYPTSGPNSERRAVLLGPTGHDQRRPSATQRHEIAPRRRLWRSSRRRTPSTCCSHRACFHSSTSWRVLSPTARRHLQRHRTSWLQVSRAPNRRAAGPRTRMLAGQTSCGARYGFDQIEHHELDCGSTALFRSEFPISSKKNKWLRTNPGTKSRESQLRLETHVTSAEFPLPVLISAPARSARPQPGPAPETWCTTMNHKRGRAGAECDVAALLAGDARSASSWTRPAWPRFCSRQTTMR